MCGLTGLARGPKAPGAKSVRMATGRLLQSIEHRGRHATGLAVVDSEGVQVWKRAVPAGVALRSDAYMEFIEGRRAPRVILGHTRHGTQNNTREDRAAHPFTVGTVTGAHNGMIYNWLNLRKEEDLTEDLVFVDSQMVFHYLATNEATTDGITSALDNLDGYWALTWWDERTGRLYACRTPDAKLAMAYAPKVKTLFWGSEMQTLCKVLSELKLEYEAWEIRPGTLYEFDPLQFDAKGTNVRRVDLPFRGRKNGASQRDLMRTSGAEPAPASAWTPKGGYSTQRSLPPAARVPDTTEGMVGDFETEIRTLRRQVAGVWKVVQDLQTRNARLESEVKYLQDLAVDSGLLDAAIQRDHEARQVELELADEINVPF